MAVDGVRGHAFGDVGGRHIGADHVVKQDVGERGLAFRRVERGQINAGVDEGLVRGCEDRERSSALQGFEQFSLDHTGDQRVVQARALSRAWDVVGRVRWGQHLVDDVNQSVAGDDVGEDHVGVVHHHATVDGERERLAVDGVRSHAFGDVRGRHIGADHVVKQDVGERGLAFGRVERCKINARVGKGLVGGREDRERPWSLQRGQQLSLNHGGHEAVVDARGLGGARDVNWRNHDLVDDVDDAVGGEDVGGGDVGVADRHPISVNTELNAVSVHRRGEHAVREGARRHRSRDHVVKQNGREGRVLLWRVEGAQIDARFGEGRVGWGKDGEGSCALQRRHQVRVGQGSHE